jgi:prophage tail gpP-like protein
VPQPPESDIRIRVRELELFDWVDYQIENNVLQPSDAFSFTTPNDYGRLTGRVKKFDPVEVIVDGTVQMTGFVDEVNSSGDAASGGNLSVTGRDKMGQCLDVSAVPQTISKLDIGQIAAKLAAPFVQHWRFENEVNRQRLIRARRALARAKQEDIEAERDLRERIIPLSEANFQDAPESFKRTIAETVAANYRANIKGDATTKAIAKAKENLAAIQRVIFPRVKVEAGQSIHAVLEEIVSEQGFAIWMAANGDGVIAKPDYKQDPLYSLFLYPPDAPDSEKNNVTSWNVTESGLEQYASYQLTGSGANTDEVFGEQARYEEFSSDEDVPLDRQLIINGKGQNRTEAKTEVARDRDWRNFNAEKIVYRVKGHKQNGLLWQTDTIVQVADDINDKHGRFWIGGRRFTVDLNGGQVTELSLYRPDIWLPS